MELFAAMIYVLAIYIGIPMYFLHSWVKREQMRGPRSAIRSRGVERIRRELARRREGLIDADEPGRTHSDQVGR